MELFRLYGNGDSTEEAPLMPFREKDGWQVWLGDGQPSA